MQTAIRYRQCVKSYNYHAIRITAIFVKKMTMKKQAAKAYLEEHIFKIFQQSCNNYGTRKIKKELEKQRLTVSRRRIGRVMKTVGLSSNYTLAYYKPQKKRSNEAVVSNVLNREFQQNQKLSVLVSDLTYVRLGKKWHYVCLFIDLFNRKKTNFDHVTQDEMKQALDLINNRPRKCLEWKTAYEAFQEELLHLI